MCTSYSFRGGAKREKRDCDVYELQLRRWIQGKEAYDASEVDPKWRGGL